MFDWLKKYFGTTPPDVPPPTIETIFDQYESKTPSFQNAIDALPGWNSSFPAELGLTAGTHPLFADGRIHWALQQYGSLEGKTVLEVGPLEGMHTFILNGAGPARIEAIEANRLCFLRCLVTQQILQIDRAQFLLGDIQEWFGSTDKVYDLAVASGVLYHMADPANFLCELARHTDTLFLWTHFYLEEAMPEGDLRRLPFTGVTEVREVEGVSVRHYERRYHQANSNASFCGGMKDKHFWLHRDDILHLLQKLGFTDIRIDAEDLAHSGGPCFSVFARKSQSN